MKSFLTIITIGFICFIGLFLVFDDFLLKQATVRILESITKKETTIGSAKISYFPTMSVSFSNVNVPHPSRNMYLFTAKKVVLGIDVQPLFSKSLIISSFVVDGADFFVQSSVPISPMYSASPRNSEAASLVADDDSIVSFSGIIDRLKGVRFDGDVTIDDSMIGGYINDIQAIIDDQLLTLNSKKSDILSQSNQLQYEMKQVKISHIKSLEDVADIRSSLERITKQVASVSKEVNALSRVYERSMVSINTVENQISESYDALANRSIISNNIGSNLLIDESTFIPFIAKKIQLFVKDDSFKPSKSRDKFIGNTYHFLKKNSPRFMIKSLQINTETDVSYVIGNNITFEPIHTLKPMHLKGKINKTYMSGTVRFHLSSLDRIEYDGSFDVSDIQVPDYLLFEDDRIRVSFQQNNQTTLTGVGRISTSGIDSSLRFQLNSPKYSVVNKSPSITSSVISMFFKRMNNQALFGELLLNGSITQPSLSFSSNLNNVLNDASNGFFQVLIDKKNDEVAAEITRLKKQRYDQYRSIIMDYTNQVNTAKSQNSFQVNQLNESINLINKKLHHHEAKLKRAVVDQIKKKIDMPSIQF